MNKVVLMGRLTADPEIRYTQSNIGVVRFSLAVDKRQKSQDGKREADFFSCLGFQQTAEFCNKYFRKGQQVLVEGRLQNNNWTDKDGIKRYSTEIVLEQVYFADSKKNDQSNIKTRFDSENDNTSKNNPQNGGETSDGIYSLNADDEDLPF
jgi:single-strand DNA-binding protein